jgi:carbon-monoxide dehydrogenase iron sulfur subunit
LNKSTKRVEAREEHCIGCGLCQVHCITVHSRYPHDIVKAFKRQSPRPVARVRLEEAKPVSFAVQCRHCDDPKCVKACITGAMIKDGATGVVTNQEDRCVGCWTCILVCPFGAITREEAGKKVAAKCDLCGDRGMPACVEHCPNGALKLVDSRGGK